MIFFLKENLDDHPHFVRHAAALMQIPFTVKQGEMIIQEGSAPEDCYFLVKGSVLIVKDSLPLMELHDNEFFGEISILLNSNREASVYALTECVCYTMSAESLKLLNRRFPTVIGQMKTIAKSRREFGQETRARKKTIVDSVMMQRQKGLLAEVIVEGMNESFESTGSLSELDEDKATTPRKKNEHIGEKKTTQTQQNNNDSSDALQRVEQRLKRIEETLSILLYKSKQPQHRNSKVLDYD